MSDQDGLICAYVLDGTGGGREIGWPEVRAWREEDEVLWVHLDRTGPEAGAWLREESGVDPVICESLLADEVRPRVLRLEDALLVILRGVNLNPGADPEDMVGVRAWLEPKRIITVRFRRLMATSDLREALANGTGPTAPSDFLVQLASRLVERMGPVIAELDDKVDALEDQVLVERSARLRSDLADVRRTAIALRRYLAPQREVMSRLQVEETGWLQTIHKAMMREIADRTMRYVEDLDAARERAAVTQEELNSLLADQMNRTMYLLTVVAAVLLPPSLLTGLLGINVGGIPGTESPFAFALVALLILVVGTVEVVLLRRLKWI
jgi:zinc transporter